jgi:hypothetical protein
LLQERQQPIDHPALDLEVFNLMIGADNLVRTLQTDVVMKSRASVLKRILVAFAIEIQSKTQSRTWEGPQGRTAMSCTKKLLCPSIPEADGSVQAVRQKASVTSS